jgi:outer membrane lipoprotein-sorting protein
MRSVLMPTLVVLLCGAAPARAQTAAPPLPAEAARMEAALKELRGVRAEFIQIRSVSLTGEEIEARGTLAFVPPHRFRLAYTTPEPQELVIRGDSLWVVMPSENQVQRYPFSEDSPGSEIFLLFGGRNRTLSEAFHISQEAWGGHRASLRLLPRQADPGYPLEEVRVVVGGNGLPEKLFFREVTGDTVAFTFTKVERNPRNADALTALHIPPGMEVIDGSAPPRELGPEIDPDRDPR